MLECGDAAARLLLAHSVAPGQGGDVGGPGAVSGLRSLPELLGESGEGLLMAPGGAGILVAFGERHGDVLPQEAAGRRPVDGRAVRRHRNEGWRSHRAVSSGPGGCVRASTAIRFSMMRQIQTRNDSSSE